MARQAGSTARRGPLSPRTRYTVRQRRQPIGAACLRSSACSTCATRRRASVSPPSKSRARLVVVSSPALQGVAKEVEPPAGGEAADAVPSHMLKLVATRLPPLFFNATAPSFSCGERGRPHDCMYALIRQVGVMTHTGRRHEPATRLLLCIAPHCSYVHPPRARGRPVPSATTRLRSLAFYNESHEQKTLYWRPQQTSAVASVRRQPLLDACASTGDLTSEMHLL